MDLLTLGLIVFGLWAAYRFGIERGRSLQSEAERLWALWQRENNPEKKKALALLWNQATGASWEDKHRFESALSKSPSRPDYWNRGARARGEGQPVSANPYRSPFLGAGRQWRKGWRWVDEHPEWAETFKEATGKQAAREP